MAVSHRFVTAVSFFSFVYFGSPEFVSSPLNFFVISLLLQGGEPDLMDLMAIAKLPMVVVVMIGQGKPCSVSIDTGSSGRTEEGDLAPSSSSYKP
ncbi:hypothetical protein L1987_83804 [Smallanthus sonchifolius]|uniref:Uncharacterized protein n=1 Tax=Smallanthus sonchifolius TaxID=185202 RepID=A0ACB8YE34_9ASTR|nr:hypothetical protein L1987_83804 [Smallanthus sonchifolius]